MAHYTRDLDILIGLSAAEIWDRSKGNAQLYTAERRNVEKSSDTSG